VNTLAGLYQSQGQYAKAEPLYLRALAISEKSLGADHPSTGSSVNNLAGLYESQGQYAKAEPLYLRALAIIEKALGADHPATGTSLNNLAGLYKSQGQYAKAEPLYMRALAISEKALGADHPSTGTSLNNLALLYQSQGQYAKAEPLYLRALAIREKALGADHPSTGTSANSLALLYHSQGQYAKAEPLYLRALAIIEKALGADHPDTSIARRNLMVLFLESSRPDRARRAILDGWTTRLSRFEKSMTYGRTTLRGRYAAELRVDIELSIAVRSEDRALRESGLQAVIAAKARTLEDTAAALQSLRARLEPDLQAKLADLDAIGVGLADIANLQSPSAAERRAALIEREDRLVAELTERSLEFRETTTTPTLADIRKRLAETGALVELLRYDELYAPKREGKPWGPARYGAFIATGTGSIQWLDLGPADPIDTHIRRFRATIASQPNRAVATEAARVIRRAIIDPIRKAMPTGVKEWHLSPDSLLHLVPLAALPEDGASAQPVLAKHPIHILTTARDLARGAPVHSAQPAWIGGLSDFGASGNRAQDLFGPIPGAKAEVDAVAAIVRPKPQLLQSGQITRDFLLERMKAPRILHLATHGSYTDEAGGRLALKDANLGPGNVLTQNDVARLHLHGTQLVVLSACESGVGAVNFADGVAGMQRALTLAGSRSQILTVWPVDDEKTRELMTAFYRNLFEKGMTKGEALRQAQLEMAGRGMHMYYWAAFVLYGDPGKLGE
jgi:CHAT domain-containing protein/Tfp pilus assembly protein PilF